LQSIVVAVSAKFTVSKVSIFENCDDNNDKHKNIVTFSQNNTVIKNHRNFGFRWLHGMDSHQNLTCHAFVIV